MIAFHGRAEVKEFYLERVREHRAADQIVQGYGYWHQDQGVFRGCAVGCTLHSGDHRAYETELGIPQILGHLEDGIFEGMPAELAQAWPEEFLKVIPVSAELDGVWPQFGLWLIVDPEWGLLRFAKRETHKDAIARVGTLYQRWVEGTKPSREEFSAAAYVAYTVAYTDGGAGAHVAAHAADAAYVALYAGAAAPYRDYPQIKKRARSAQADELLRLLAAAPVAAAA